MSGLQLDFFNKLSALVGSKILLAKQISEILPTSLKTAGRKIAGTTELTMVELHKLAAFFHISLDEHFGFIKNQYTFEFAALGNHNLTLLNFLNPIYADLSMLRAVPNVEIWYASQELPFFYYLKYPNLSYFKLYSLLLGNRRDTPDDLKSLANFQRSFSNEALKMIPLINQYYLNTKRYEIWNLNVLTNTLNQLKYYFLSGQLGDKASVMLILSEFKQMIADIHDMATDHSSNATMNLYHNEIIHTNNAITVKNPYQPVVYVTFNNPNYFKIVDPAFVQYTYEWLDVLLYKATPLTNGSEKDIKYFFRSLNESIDRILSKIEAE